MTNIATDFMWLHIQNSTVTGWWLQAWVNKWVKDDGSQVIKTVKPLTVLAAFCSNINIIPVPGCLSNMSSIAALKMLNIIKHLKCHKFGVAP